MVWGFTMGQKDLAKARQYLVIVLLVIADVVTVSMSPYLALWLRFDGVIEPQWLETVANLLPLIVGVRIGVFYFFRLYHRMWRYASINELVVVCGAVTVSSFLLFGVSAVVDAVLPRSVWILAWMLNIVFVGFSRLVLRVYYYWRTKFSSRQRDKVMIVGAGDAGAMIARELLQRYQATKELVGFVDDDPGKRYQMMFGMKILGHRYDLPLLATQYNIDEVIIAIPSAGGAVLREIAGICKTLGCSVKTVPGIYELIDGKVTIGQLRSIDLEDLLRREQIHLNDDNVRDFVKGKTVLVTGAGGSIGSELCRQIAKHGPAQLVMLGKGENSIYEIHQELRGKFPDLPLFPVIADVRDGTRIHEVFDHYRPQLVFHAAAHKHVPLMEAQPSEAVQNNVFGTKTVAEAAGQAGAEAFIMISTDKAVNPTSVMGATKRIAELYIQHMNCTYAKTRFSAVRFGNVLGSRGSVIPLFRRQIAAGGPVTVTDPEMRRYFMTIPEAVQLVLQAGVLARGGEVFVLDMGQPVRILDMAKDLIELSGLRPYEDIAIQFTGLRPGEKLFEELLTAEEGTTSTTHAKIFRANLRQVDGSLLEQKLVTLRKMRDEEAVRNMIRDLVPTYHQPQASACESGKQG